MEYRDTPSRQQLQAVKEKLPEQLLKEGFVIKTFVAVGRHWRVCVESIGSEVFILEGTCNNCG